MRRLWWVALVGALAALSSGCLAVNYAGYYLTRPFDRKAPGFDTTPMHDAAWAGDVGKIRRLAKEQPELVDKPTSSDHNTPLMLAICNRRWKAAGALIEEGANVNATNKYADTPLLEAVDQWGSLEMVKVLLDSGADITSRGSHGTTVLHVADDEEVVALLIARGADVNAEKEGGWTPLHVAYSGKIAELLLADGAELEARTSGQETPLIRVASGYGDPADVIMCVSGPWSERQCPQF